MLHAFFRLFSCLGRECEGNSNCQLGATGHGIAFQKAALAIEKAARVHWGRHWDIGRVQSYALEYRSSQNMHIIRQLELNPNEIRLQTRNIEQRGTRKLRTLRKLLKQKCIIPMGSKVF